MRSIFIVQILRADGWRKLTTIKTSASGVRDEDRAREDAKLRAAVCLTGWRNYFGGHLPLRVEELRGY